MTASAKSSAASSLLDLRSDTVTRPTPAMLAAMMAAEVGDDVFSEDPTVKALEAELAAMLGKAAALFVPTGTMANQLAIAIHTRPGDSVIAEQDSHIFINEAGGAAALSGVQCDLVPYGMMEPAALIAAYREDGLQAAPSSLLMVENTHNRGGGRVLSVDRMQALAATARQLGLASHCDGARLWNAAVALQVTEQDLVGSFDTVAVCFSKGLGAPVGSALVGSREHIERARKVRKRWGGGMRQAGYLAAGALHGLRHHRARLAEDHARAAEIAARLRTVDDPGFEVVYPDPGTNIVYVRVAHANDPMARARRIVAAMRERGVLAVAVDQGWIRFVTHLDLPAGVALRTCDAFIAAARETI